MISGAQIRAARQLLGWTITTTSLAARVTFWNVTGAKRLDGGGLVAVDKIEAIQGSCLGSKVMASFRNFGL